MRYELVPITHDELRLFCKLGGWTFVPRRFLSPERFGMCKPADELRTDCLLIGAHRNTFVRLTEKEREEIIEMSIKFSQYRHERNSSKNNARILVLCP